MGVSPTVVQGYFICIKTIIFIHLFGSTTEIYTALISRKQAKKMSVIGRDHLLFLFSTTDTMNGSSDDIIQCQNMIFIHK